MTVPADYTDGTMVPGFEDALVDAAEAERERDLASIPELRARVKATEKKLAEERDCGQTVTCAIAPGCQRHWLERNRELAAERDAALKQLAELVREVRELEREPRMGGPNFSAIMQLVGYEEPEGGA